MPYILQNLNYFIIRDFLQLFLEMSLNTQYYVLSNKNNNNIHILRARGRYNLIRKVAFHVINDRAEYTFFKISIEIVVLHI